MFRGLHFVRQAVWPTHWLVVWSFIDWLIDWLVDWLISWLIDDCDRLFDVQLRTSSSFGTGNWDHLWSTWTSLMEVRRLSVAVTLEVFRSLCRRQLVDWKLQTDFVFAPAVVRKPITLGLGSTFQELVQLTRILFCSLNNLILRQ